MIEDSGKKLGYPNPWMREKEVEIICELLKERKPSKCLEWGSGGSTTYFPKRFEFINHWRAIEIDKSWVEKVKEDISRENLSNEVIIDLKEDKNEYINITDNFDFILIDGDWRVECLEQASNILRENGFCLLHDSGRSKYEEGYKFYDKVKELTKGRTPSSKGEFKEDGLTLLEVENE